MHKFKELKVWQKSRVLVKSVYQLTKNFPASEQFGITSQMQRAAVSIPANIAEGAGRNTNKDFARFLDIANGSSFELETLVYLCIDLEYISDEEFNHLNESILEVQRMLYSLKEKVKF
ncbi:four helix bundle protein [Carboxylicivirga sp. A043]|uniref:four helix bundle protein n=1 Tax=Carboxylicivirga litoralis TaxID=2816963 RepID=UPI0021CB1090|nr:four helix bundle protein [Carboxylicivirga sp. A043]MCU4155984.1 four helix bundle protein [Carboxylicivirga sp. A043]